MQEQDLKNQDALIAHNRQTGESGVVTGLKQDGSPKMEDPAKVMDFLKFDRHADMLDNFLRNFAAQFKNPTIFNFFKVPADQVGTVGFAVNQMVKDPESAAAKEMLAGYEVKVPDGVQSRLRMRLKLNLSARILTPGKRSRHNAISRLMNPKSTGIISLHGA